MAERPLVAVLAAGRSARFGGNKLEARCAGKPLGRWSLDAVTDAGLGPGIIVTGPLGVSFADSGWTRLVNPRPEDGLGSSLAIAARHALATGAATLLVVLADMPLVLGGYLRVLAATPAPAASRYADGSRGVPALLDRRLIGEAANLCGERGLKSLLRDATPLPSKDLLWDVDTPEDLAEVERQLLAR